MTFPTLVLHFLCIDDIFYIFYGEFNSTAVNICVVNAEDFL